MRARYEAVTDLQGAVLDEDRGDGTFANVQFRFDNRAHCRPVGVGT